mgnify:CR=1 FL=1
MNLPDVMSPEDVDSLLAEPDAVTGGYVGGDAAGGGEVERVLVRRAEHQRAPLRPHVVAHEGEQPVHQLARIVGGPRRAGGGDGLLVKGGGDHGGAMAGANGCGGGFDGDGKAIARAAQDLA